MNTKQKITLTILLSLIIVLGASIYNPIEHTQKVFAQSAYCCDSTATNGYSGEIWGPDYCDSSVCSYDATSDTSSDGGGGNGYCCDLTATNGYSGAVWEPDYCDSSICLYDSVTDSVADSVPDSVADSVPPTSYVCCNPYANNCVHRTLEEYEECDNNQCTYDSVPDSESVPDSVPPSVPDSVPTKPAICCNDSSNSYAGANACANLNNDPMYDEPTCKFTHVCCDQFTNGQKNENYCGQPTAKQGEKCDSSVCSLCPDYVCCSENATNYVSPENRPSGNDNCAPNGEGGTTCRTDSPTCKFDTCDPAVQDCGCGLGQPCNTCVGSASCSVSSGSITGEGSASFSLYGNCDPTDPALNSTAASACSSLVNVYLPLNTPQSSSIFTYVLTSVDYCQNIPGDQHGIPPGYYKEVEGDCVTEVDQCADAGGTWVEPDKCVKPQPVCGSASGNVPAESAPTSNLCNPGTPSSVLDNNGSYNWTCADPQQLVTVACSVPKCTDPNTCGNNFDYCLNIEGIQNQQYVTDNNLARTSNGECYPVNVDLCSNIPGTQDPEDLATLNVYRDEYGKCWDNVIQACGTAMNSLTWYNPPQTNLCSAGSYPSSVVVNSDDTKYLWTCKDNDNDLVVGNCQVNKLCQEDERLCGGACIAVTETCNEVATTTLITNFRVQPKVVQKATDSCNLSWTADLRHADATIASGCTVDGYDTGEPNTTFSGSKLIRPGIHNMYCHVGDAYQNKQVRCEVNPDFKEI